MAKPKMSEADKKKKAAAKAKAAEDRKAALLTMTDEQKKAFRATEKTEKFARLAPPRMTKALTAIENVARLGTRAQYGYSDEQVTKIREALMTALNGCMRKFAAGGDTAAPSGFTF